MAARKGEAVLERADARTAIPEPAEPEAGTPAFPPLPDIFVGGIRLGVAPRGSLAVRAWTSSDPAIPAVMAGGK